MIGFATALTQYTQCTCCAHSYWARSHAVTLVREEWNSGWDVMSLDQAELTESSECHLVPDFPTWLHKGERRGEVSDRSPLDVDIAVPCRADPDVETIHDLRQTRTFGEGWCSNKPTVRPGGATTEYHREKCHVTGNS